MGNTIEIRMRSLTWGATGAALAVAATLIVTSAWSVTAAPGDDDATYVPTAGCRVTDTRETSNLGPKSTPLGANEEMTVTIHGANGECTGGLAIPTDAVGVSLNVTAVAATAQSNLRVYRADLPSPPTLSNLNVVPGGPPTPNKVDVQLSPDGRIKVYNFKGNVQVIIDVLGYYTGSSLTDIDSRLSALEAGQAALQAGQAALEAGQPFVVADNSAETADNISDNFASPTIVADVTVDAPTDGEVALVGTAIAGGGDADKERALCSVTIDGAAFDLNGPYGAASPLPVDAFPTGTTTRTFDVAAGSSTIFTLVCYQLGSTAIDMYVPSLVALFTPTP